MDLLQKLSNISFFFCGKFSFDKYCLYPTIPTKDKRIINILVKIINSIDDEYANIVVILS